MNNMDILDRLGQAKQIVNGATNYAKLLAHIPNSEVEKISKLRMRVCNLCPNRDTVLNKCKICTCFLGLKTRSMESSCPIGNWAAVAAK